MARPRTARPPRPARHADASGPGGQAKQRPRPAAGQATGQAARRSTTARIRFSDTGSGVPSVWAKRLTRNSSIIQRIAAASSPERAGSPSSLSARRWPAVRVEPNVLYVDDGQILTSAGAAAGLDLCLHIVRRDHGTRIANTLARRLVVPPHREGGQAQYIEQPLPAAAPGLSVSLDWAREHLELPLTVEDLARQAAMSPRTYARRFRETTGTTPLQWLCRERVRRAQDLLENTDDTIDRIAARCGFGSAPRLRSHFTRVNRVTPHEYQRTFRARAAA